MGTKEASVVYIRLEDPVEVTNSDGKRLIVGWALLGKQECFSERVGSLDFLISETVVRLSEEVS
jgi:hypothetical protein